jgi:hypothetical protein
MPNPFAEKGKCVEWKCVRDTTDEFSAACTKLGHCPFAALPTGTPGKADYELCLKHAQSIC